MLNWRRNNVFPFYLGISSKLYRLLSQLIYWLPNKKPYEFLILEVAVRTCFSEKAFLNNFADFTGKSSARLVAFHKLTVINLM